jgi:hypothetical protein
MITPVAWPFCQAKNVASNGDLKRDSIDPTIGLRLRF